ncbi:MAG TPA: hypothetical protein VGG37_00130 [Opitutaceae bacterium]
MSSTVRWTRLRLWLVVPLCAVGFLAWNGAARIGRIDSLSSLPGRAHVPDKPDPPSAAGDTRVLRDLVLPGGGGRAFDWIEQTELMAARGEARVRHVGYENAPEGHAVSLTSPYRWWLGLVSVVREAWSDETFARSVEQGALLADPWIQGLVVIGAAALAGWRFGRAAGLAVSLGAAFLFPFSARFLPGHPGPDGLSAACALGSVLFFLAGIRPVPPQGQAPDPRPWLALSGAVGALGLWVSVQAEAPILIGLGLGGLLSAFLQRSRASALAPEAWRFWGLTGGGLALLAFLLEYFPGHLSDVTLGSIHPLYGLAWMGAGDLMARAVARASGQALRWTGRDKAIGALALLAVLAPLVWMGRSASWGFLAKDADWSRLAALPDAAVAANTGAWLAKEAATAAAWATVLPFLMLASLAGIALRTMTEPASRTAVAIALGPAAVALALAWADLAWWGLLDGVLLALAAACAAPGWAVIRRPGRWWVVGAVALGALLGVARILPRGEAGSPAKLTPAESEELVDRHLGHWLALHAGETGAIVFAPPVETASLCFYGGLRGIGTLSPDNVSGFDATLAIASSQTLEEAHDLLQRRGVRFVVLPLWDPFFDNLGKLYLAGTPSSQASLFARELRSFNLPPWIRPIPYQTPIQGGAGSLEILIYEVEEGQSPAASAGRQAEYFVEMGQLDLAAAAAERLARFPGDVGALVARAEVQIARNETAESAKTVVVLQDRLASGADRFLPWDRRVSLAIVMAQAGKIDLCREQAIRSASEANEARLRTLTTGSLLNFLVICHSLGIELPDPRLRALAVDLLPVDLRSRI